MPHKIRPIRIEGQLAYVTLTRGFEAVVDLADLPVVEGRNWQAWRSWKQTFYARTGHGQFYLHRLILDAPQGLLVDHIDCDGLNNRRSNLRLASSSQNRMNSRKFIPSTSGHKGASFHALSGKWVARIGYLGKDKYLGIFDTPEEAHSAYCAAAKKLYGEFARGA